MNGGKLRIVSGCLFFLSFWQIYVIQGLHIEPTRVKRGIFGTVTSTEYETVFNKIYVPSSCIYMGPNLTNYCRNVRFLFPQNKEFGFFGNEITSTSTAELQPKITYTNIVASGRQDLNPPTKTVYVQGWGEYLGLYKPTVTVTSTKFKPTTVLDPWITITYAIKGCKPHNLPKDLEKCPEEDRLELTDIVPTSTVRSRITATKLPDVNVQGAVVESADIELVEVPENNKATKSL